MKTGVRMRLYLEVGLRGGDETVSAGQRGGSLRRRQQEESIFLLQTVSTTNCTSSRLLRWVLFRQ